jgi:hypothetical protein
MGIFQERAIFAVQQIILIKEIGIKQKRNPKVPSVAVMSCLCHLRNNDFALASTIIRKPTPIATSIQKQPLVSSSLYSLA